MKFSILFSLALLFFAVKPQLYAQNLTQKITDFFEAHEAVYQPNMTTKDIDHYLSFTADEITDFHAAYGVTLEGKEPFRRGLPGMAAGIKSFEVEIGKVIISSNMATAEYTEYVINIDSKTKEANVIRTVLVFEFDEAGKIIHMRRYLDSK